MNYDAIIKTVDAIYDSMQYAKKRKISERIVKHTIAMILDSAMNDRIEQHEIEKLEKIRVFI